MVCLKKKSNFSIFIDLILIFFFYLSYINAKSANTTRLPPMVICLFGFLQYIYRLLMTILQKKKKKLPLINYEFNAVPLLKIMT